MQYNRFSKKTDQPPGIKSAFFIGSSSQVEKCPEPVFPEYAFIGRSNVGKSSLINLVCGKKNLARVSNKPGKTKLINHFLIGPSGGQNKAPDPAAAKKGELGKWYLVDLPGYGYAGVSKGEREGWKKWFADYFLKRENLMCTFVLLDSRLPPQNIDMEFMNGLGLQKVPFSMVFTKADKVSSNELVKNISVYKREMLQHWQELPHIFISSSVSKRGKEEILWFIDQTNKKWVAPQN